MNPRPSIQNRLSLVIFWIAGIVMGIFFVTPKSNGDKFLGGSIGFMSSLLLSFLVFPELRKMLRNIWDGDDIAGINMKNYFTHPTQKPLVLGMLWFLVFILLSTIGLFNPLFDRLPDKDKSDLLFLFLSPSFLFFGISGLISIKRNEAVGRYGQIYNGGWAYFNGIMLIVFGWGALLFMLLAYVFNW